MKSLYIFELSLSKGEPIIYLFSADVLKWDTLSAIRLISPAFDKETLKASIFYKNRMCEVPYSQLVAIVMPMQCQQFQHQ